MQIIQVILIFLMLFFHPAKGQDTIDSKQKVVKYDTQNDISPVQFDPQNIAEYRSERDFAYVKAQDQDNWWTRVKRWVNIRYEQFIHWLFGDYEANTIVAFLLRVLPYFIIGVIAGFIIWLFIRLNPGNYLLQEPEEPEVFLNEEEKIIKSQNIPRLIEEAISQGNFRLAIRYYYLQLLKELNNKGIIEYESQKTNADYLQEIRKEELRQPLRNIIRIYDFSWYGGFSITENNFQSVQRSFREMESRLKGNRNE